MMAVVPFPSNLHGGEGKQGYYAYISVAASCNAPSARDLHIVHISRHTGRVYTCRACMAAWASPDRNAGTPRNRD